MHRLIAIPLIAGHDADPLYTGAPLSKEASWISIYQFAVSNRLTDIATQQLIELIKCTAPP